MSSKANVFLITFVVLTGIASAGTLTATPAPYTFSNTVIDVGQQSAAQTAISGGLGSYSGNVMWTPPWAGAASENTLTAELGTGNYLSFTVAASSSNTAEITFNGVQYAAIAPGTNTIYGAWTFNIAAADLGGGNTVSSSNTITVNPALQQPSFTAANSALLQGSPQTLTATTSGGTAPYTYNFIVYNALGEVANALYSTSSTTNTFSFTVNSYWGLGTLTANVQLYDSATAKVSASNTLTFSVNSPLQSASFSASAAAADQGQVEKLTSSASGGIQPFTYNFLVYNAPGVLVANAFYQSVPTSANSFSFQVNSAWGTGAFTANIFLTSDTNTVDNSLSFTVNSAPTATLTPYNVVLDTSQRISYGVSPSGGVGPFTASLVLLGNTVNTITGIQPGSSGSVVANEPAGTYTFNVLLTDTGTGSSPFTFNTASNTVRVFASPTVTMNATNGTTISISQTETITVNVPLGLGVGPFTGTINFGTQSTSISIPAGGGNTYAVFQPAFTATYPSNVFLSDQGTTTHFAFNSSTTLISVISKVTSSGGGGGGGTGVSSTTVTTTTSTTTTSTVATTTIPQVHINSTASGSVNVTISNLVPAIANFSSGTVTVKITTNSPSPVSTSVSVRNYTALSPPPPQNLTKAIAVDIAIGPGHNLTVNVTVRYNCTLPPNNVFPFILNGSVWEPITKFYVNQLACVVTFKVPADPVVALMYKPLQLEVPKQTTSTTTIPVPQGPAPTSTSGFVSLVEGAIVVIAIAAVVSYLVSREGKGAKGGTRRPRPDIKPGSPPQAPPPPPVQQPPPAPPAKKAPRRQARSKSASAPRTPQ